MPPTATATPNESPEAMPRCAGRYDCPSVTAGGLNRFTHGASTMTATTHSHTFPEVTNATSANAISAKQPTISRGVGIRCETMPDAAVANAPQTENTVISSDAASSDAPNVATRYSGKKLVTP